MTSNATTRAGRRALEVDDLESGAVTVRMASARDARALDRLAQLDSTRPPAGPTLVAEIDGELVAAVPILGGRPVADPFRLTARLVTLLETRAAQLTTTDRPRLTYASLLGRWRRATPASDPRSG